MVYHQKQFILCPLTTHLRYEVVTLVFKYRELENTIMNKFYECRQQVKSINGVK